MSLGSGTQKIEERIRKLFPKAQVRRVDRDTIKTKAAIDALYDDMHDNKIDILVGTQMLSKGHDFPNLSLVVVLDSDNALYSSDFRYESDHSALSLRATHQTVPCFEL